MEIGERSVTMSTSSDLKMMPTEESQRATNIRVGDEDRLAQLGYEQELRRNWSLLHNFGVSFSIISVITGITTLFEYGLSTGGPGVMSIGWIVVCFFTMFVALGMAEIVSAIPTSGGPYFWAAILAPGNGSAFAAWITGWYGPFSSGCHFVTFSLPSFNMQVKWSLWRLVSQ